MRPYLIAHSLIAALLLVSCGTDAGTGETPDPGAQPPADGPAALADGEHMGFLLAVDGATISLDEATWIVADDEPNGYRIDNDVVDPVDLTLSDDPDIEVLLSTGDPSTAAQVDAAGLASWFTGLGSEEEPVVDVTVQDGEVVALHFRYRP
jgi:hypothetical protein